MKRRKKIVTNYYAARDNQSRVTRIVSKGSSRRHDGHVPTPPPLGFEKNKKCINKSVSYLSYSHMKVCKQTQSTTLTILLQ